MLIQAPTKDFQAMCVMVWLVKMNNLHLDTVEARVKVNADSSTKKGKNN